MTSDYSPDDFREARLGAAVRTRRVRIILGIAILILSMALLIWGFWPARHETRTQPISPTDLQLPTPASFETQLNLFI